MDSIKGKTESNCKMLLVAQFPRLRQDGSRRISYIDKESQTSWKDSRIVRSTLGLSFPKRSTVLPCRRLSDRTGT